MPIKATRALLHAALDGSLANVEMRVDPHFKFRVPVAVPGVDSKILNPRETWADKSAYDAQASKLVSMFQENFRKFEAHVGQDVLRAAPNLAEAAE
jgi:phosphoenolpyruvate carboxykinase (ATP)